MDQREQAQVLIAEFGTSIGLNQLAFDDDNKVVLMLDEVKVLNLVLDGDASAIALMTRIAEVEFVTEDVCRRALTANFGWQDTGGATLACDPDEGALLLQQRLVIGTMDVNQLRATIESFLAISDVWTAITVDPSLLEDSDDDPVQPPVSQEQRDDMTDFAMRLKYQA